MNRAAPIAAPARAEALRRSLLAAEALPEEAPVLAVRASRWSETFRPQNDFQIWLVGQVAELSLRIDRCGRSESRLRARASLRAESCWDDDRRGEAEALGARLAARPSVVVEQLRRTAAGCDWLIRRWAMLARAADLGPWTEDQARLAFDLLGTPAEFRAGTPGEAIDEEGRVDDPAEGPAAVARRQIASLQGRRVRLAEVDGVDRALVMAGQFDNACPEIRRLRRHESALNRRLRWCLAQLRAGSPGAEVGPARLVEAPPAPARPSRPQPDPGPEDFSEFDLDPIALEELRREAHEQMAALGLNWPSPAGRPVA